MQQISSESTHDLNKLKKEVEKLMNQPPFDTSFDLVPLSDILMKVNATSIEQIA